MRERDGRREAANDREERVSTSPLEPLSFSTTSAFVLFISTSSSKQRGGGEGKKKERKKERKKKEEEDRGKKKRKKYICGVPFPGIRREELKFMGAQRCGGR